MSSSKPKSAAEEERQKHRDKQGKYASYEPSTSAADELSGIGEGQAFHSIQADLESRLDKGDGVADITDLLQETGVSFAEIAREDDGTLVLSTRRDVTSDVGFALVRKGVLPEGVDDHEVREWIDDHSDELDAFMSSRYGLEPSDGAEPEVYQRTMELDSGTTLTRAFDSLESAETRYFNEADPGSSWSDYPWDSFVGRTTSRVSPELRQAGERASIFPASAGCPDIDLETMAADGADPERIEAYRRLKEADSWTLPSGAPVTEAMNRGTGERYSLDPDTMTWLPAAGGRPVSDDDMVGSRDMAPLVSADPDYSMLRQGDTLTLPDGRGAIIRSKGDYTAVFFRPKTTGEHGDDYGSSPSHSLYKNGRLVMRRWDQGPCPKVYGTPDISASKEYETALKRMSRRGRNPAEAADDLDRAIQSIKMPTGPSSLNNDHHKKAMADHITAELGSGVTRRQAEAIASRILADRLDGEVRVPYRTDGPSLEFQDNQGRDVKVWTSFRSDEVAGMEVGGVPVEDARRYSAAALTSRARRWANQ